MVLEMKREMAVFLATVLADIVANTLGENRILALSQKMTMSSE